HSPIRQVPPETSRSVRAAVALVHVGQGDLAGATGSSSVTSDGPVLDVSAEMSLELFHAGLVAPRGGRHVRGGASIACGNPAATTLGTVERLVRAAGWSRSAWSRMPPRATS